MNQSSQGMRILVVIAMVAGLGIAACSKQEPPKSSIISDTGRPETRKIEAADAIGYNGKAIRQKLDKALDENDARTKQIDQAVDQ